MLLIVLYSSAYGQRIEPVHGGFFIDRQYAEIVAARFDSLEQYKAIAMQTDSALNTCLQLTKAQKQEANLIEMKAKLLQESIEDYKQTAISYQNEIELQGAEIKRLRSDIKSRKRAKTWAIIGGIAAGAAGGFIVGVFIAK